MWTLACQILWETKACDGMFKKDLSCYVYVVIPWSSCFFQSSQILITCNNVSSIGMLSWKVNWVNKIHKPFLEKLSLTKMVTYHAT